MNSDVAAESTPSDPSPAHLWRRSSYCANGACVEVAVDGPRVGIRDAKAPGAGALWLTPTEFRAFVAAVSAEDFG